MTYIIYTCCNFSTLLFLLFLCPFPLLSNHAISEPYQKKSPLLSPFLRQSHSHFDTLLHHQPTATPSKALTIPTKEFTTLATIFLPEPL